MPLPTVFLGLGTRVLCRMSDRPCFLVIDILVFWIVRVPGFEFGIIYIFKSLKYQNKLSEFPNVYGAYYSIRMFAYQMLFDYLNIR